MLSNVNQLVKYDLKVAIKLHPGTTIEQYNFVERDLNNIIIYNDQVLIEKFIEECDYIVCSGSTVFIESLIFLKPVFLFKSDRKDIFEEIEWCAFRNSVELGKLINWYKENPKEFEKAMVKTRSYFTETDNVKEKYIDFYKSLQKE